MPLKTRRIPVHFQLTLFVMTWLAPSLHAETISIPLDGDIQAAIDAALPFDELELAAGVYRLEEPLLPMGKYVTIRGALDQAGGPASILDGQGKTRHIKCVNGEIDQTVFENLVLTNGFAAYAGSISNFGARPTINNCHFIGNVSTSDAGAILNNVSRPIVTNCVFRDNVANFSGGAVCNYNSSDATFTSCSFSGNQARTGGAMVNLSTSDPVLTDCTFIGNDARNGGGLASWTGSRPAILASSFIENTAKELGGGIYAEDEASAPVLAGTSFCGNHPGAIDGPWSDDGGNCLSGACPLCPVPCPADIDLDGDIDGADLAFLLGDWGESGSAGDLNDDGTVNGADIALILGVWGSCP